MRVLLVTYTFPPVGGAGVQRPTKFVKYLPQHGWDVTVLTASNPSVPLFDETLLSDVPAGTVVERARTLEPSYKTKKRVAVGSGTERVSWTSRVKQLTRSVAAALLRPDAQVLWVPGALRKGSQILRNVRHDVVLATAPPFSTFLAAERLAQRFRLPFVLDYRDEWDISNAHWENRRFGRGIESREQRVQSRLLRRASAVVATTRASAGRLAEKASASGHDDLDVRCIYNGFDPDDFRTPATTDPRETVRIVYTGTLWELTSVAPLVEAVRVLERTDPGALSRLELSFTGRRTPPQDELVRRLETAGCRLDLVDYRPHDQAVAVMGGADALCVLLSDSDDARRVVPAKVFEYMAARRPILAIAPRGELWELLADHPAARLHAPDDVEGIAVSLAEISNFGVGTVAADWDCAKHSRHTQAGELAEVLESVVRRRS